MLVRLLKQNEMVYVLQLLKTAGFQATKRA